jgi:dipeptidyl aminopeptidase/acylaminoacyl peptidase
MPTRTTALLVPLAAWTLLADAATTEPTPSAASAGSAASATSAAAHIYLEVSLSPNGRYVAAIEGDSAPAGGDPVVRDLVIRTVDGAGQVVVALPCADMRGCWPGSPAWTPDSRRLAFTLRDPQTHARTLLQVGADGSGLIRLSGFNGAIQTLRYSREGELALLAVENPAKEVGPREAGTIVGDLDSAPREQRIAVLGREGWRWVSPPDLYVYEYDWIPDGHGFVGTAAPGDGERNWWVSKLYTFPRDGAPAQVLYAPASAQQQLAQPRVSRDGKRVAFIAGLMSDFGSNGGDLYTVPLSGGAATAITPALAASVNDLHWNCRGHLLATVLARADHEIVDFGNGIGASAGEVLWRGPELIGESRMLSFADCPSASMALTHQSYNEPSEIELGPIGRWRDLTHVNAGLSTRYPVRSLSWKNEQLDVQGWLLLPERNGAALPPLITVVHGGPAAASEPHFISSGPWRSLLDHGYALFLPNPRGSFGMGEAFVAANVRDFGHGDLRDILAGLDAVAALGLTDPERLGITGRSYGGFMTMWAITQTDRFRAAVAGAGISNWQSYYGENGIDEWMIPYFGASVYDDPAGYARSSAINYIRQAHTPTFSFVGAADIECPAPQTLEFGHALRVLGTPSSTVIYPEEGHVIRDPRHLADIDARTLAWFDRYLK